MPRIRTSPKLADDVGRRLRQTLGLLGLANKAFCQAYSVGTSRLSNWLGGANVADLDKMIDLCDDYGLTLDWIYRGRLGGLPSDFRDKLTAEKGQEAKTRASRAKKGPKPTPPPLEKGGLE